MFFLKQMRPPQQMQGRLKSFSVETTQGIWSIDVSSITGAGKPPADATQQPQPSARPQPQVPRDANMVKTKTMPPTRSVHQSQEQDYIRQSSCKVGFMIPDIFYLSQQM